MEVREGVREGGKKEVGRREEAGDNEWEGEIEERKRGQVKRRQEGRGKEAGGKKGGRKNQTDVYNIDEEWVQEIHISEISVRVIPWDNIESLYIVTNYVQNFKYNWLTRNESRTVCKRNFYAFLWFDVQIIILLSKNRSFVNYSK